MFLYSGTKHLDYAESPDSQRLIIIMHNLFFFFMYHYNRYARLMYKNIKHTHNWRLTVENTVPQPVDNAFHVKRYKNRMMLVRVLLWLPQSLTVQLLARYL